MRPALQVSGLGKGFRHRSTSAPATFRGWVESGFRRRLGAPFWALRDVAFSVAPGEMMGVIGRNGSGKSTLLRLLGGVMRPDEGSVIAAAPVNGLLELNTGMHPDLTGRENVRINGVLGGLLLSEVEERMDRIIDFAELEDHIDDPVRTYSSGMKLRLGFAVAVHVDPAILLIDEVLAVGDLGFQQKCLARIREFKANGCAIVLISHDMTQIRQMCDRALWIDRGEMRALGDPDAVVTDFEGAMNRETARRTALAAREPDPAGTEAAPRAGSGEAVLSEVCLLGQDGTARTVLAPGDGLVVQATVTCGPQVEGWQMSVTITDAAGLLCLDVNTEADGIAMPVAAMPVAGAPAAAAPVTVQMSIDRLDLRPGDYVLSLGVWQPDWHYAYDYLPDVRRFQVSGSTGLKGLLFPPRSWRIVDHAD